MPNNTRGKFIVFEGLDGSGKGTYFPDYRRWRADGAYDTFNNETGDPYEIDLSG